VDYVMVPVPEELAEKVLSYVSWKGPPGVGASRQADDEPDVATDAPAPVGDSEPIARAFARLDDGGRALAAVIASAALDHEELTIPEAARRAGVTTREAVGAIVELVNFVANEGGPPMAAVIKEAEGANGDEFSWDARVVMVSEPVAHPLAEAARTHGSS
jgi:hypothetical protein